MAGLDLCREAYHKYLGWNEGTLDTVDAVLSSFVANYLSGAKELVWLFIIGPASTGKTEILKTLMDFNPDGGWEKGRAIPNNSMTPKAFVSGYRDKEKPGVDPSLLARLQDGGVLISPDITTMLSMRADDLQYILGQMRGAFDGRFDSAAGNGGSTTYKTGFGWIGACTEALDDFRMTQQVMGERTLIIRNSRYMSSMTEQQRLLERSRSMTNATKHAWRTTVASTVCGLLDATIRRMATDPAPTVTVDPNASAWFEALSFTLARLRTVPLKKSYVGAEGPQRLNNQLRSIVSARALLENRTHVLPADMRLAVRLAQDTLPPVLSVMAHALWAAGDSYVDTGTLEEVSGCPRQDVHRQLTQWCKIGILEGAKGTWKFTAGFRQVAGSGKFFDDPMEIT